MDKCELIGSLRNRHILDILIGDDPVGKYDDIELKMPYLSGNGIFSIWENILGKEYTELRFDSRWGMLGSVLVKAIEDNKIKDVLTFIFSKKQFASKSSTPSVEIYNVTTEYAITKINKVLDLYDFKFKLDKNICTIEYIGKYEDTSDHNIPEVSEGNGDKLIHLNYIILTNALLFSKSKDEAISWIEIINGIDDFPTALLDKIQNEYVSNDFLTLNAVVENLYYLFGKFDKVFQPS